MIKVDTAKIPIILVMAVAINVILFTAIETMIGMQRIRLSDASDIEIANFIRVNEQSREVRSRRDPEAPQKPPKDVQQDLRRLSDASQSNLSGLSIDIPDINVDIGVSGDISIARELTPLVRVPPEYPMAALIRKQEGYVLMRFRVTETGSVADPEVLRSDPPGVFDRAARRAVLKFKYQPQFANGKPVSVMTYTRLTFVMADEQ